MVSILYVVICVYILFICTYLSRYVGVGIAVVEYFCISEI